LSEAVEIKQLNNLLPQEAKEYPDNLLLEPSASFHDTEGHIISNRVTDQDSQFTGNHYVKDMLNKN